MLTAVYYIISAFVQSINISDIGAHMNHVIFCDDIAVSNIEALRLHIHYLNSIV